MSKIKCTIEKTMGDYDSIKDTQEHISRFQSHLAMLYYNILLRYNTHDTSKLESPEKETFDRVTPALRGLTYGSEEYKAQLADMQEALDHHYKHNRHHPEHYKDGMRGMTLVDLVEMFCDWGAATERHEDGNIGKSIRHNMERFGFGETLAQIMANTAEEYAIGRRCDFARCEIPEQKEVDNV